MGLTAVLGASLGTSVLSTGATAYSQSNAIRTQGKYQQQQLETNMRLANIQANDAIARGESAANEQKKKVKQLIGTQRAALAAQGIEVNSDTALDIQADTAGMGALDVLTIKNNAWREAWGYKVQALDYSGQAVMAGISSKFNATQTLLTGGMNIAKDVTGGIYSYESVKAMKVK